MWAGRLLRRAVPLSFVRQARASTQASFRNSWVRLAQFSSTTSETATSASRARDTTPRSPVAAAAEDAAAEPATDRHAIQRSTATGTEQAVQQYRPGDRRPGWAGFFRGLFGGTQAAVEDTLAAEARRRGWTGASEATTASNNSGRGVEAAARSQATATSRVASHQASSALVPQKRPHSQQHDAEDDAASGASYASVLDRVFSRFAGSPFMRSVLDAKERVSERLDESDHPVVNAFRALHDRLFAENEMAQVLRAIRTVDRTFTISHFIAEMENQVIPTVLQAYLTGDLETLRAHCTEEAFAMMSASIHERRLSGIVMDPRILNLDQVELVTGRFLDEEPILIVQFTAQQIHCLRNQQGEVIEGAPDDIRAVYYVWALCRASPSEPGPAESDAETSTTWRILEMVIRGAHATI
jgi:predicted lipid-binding transport protein (Tim44 family)